MKEGEHVVLDYVNISIVMASHWLCMDKGRRKGRQNRVLVLIESPHFINIQWNGRTVLVVSPMVT